MFASNDSALRLSLLLENVFDAAQLSRAERRRLVKPGVQSRPSLLQDQATGRPAYISSLVYSHTRHTHVRACILEWN